MDKHGAHIKKEFRTPTWLKVTVASSVILFSAVATLLFIQDGWTWISLAAMVLVIISIAGLVDSLTCCVVLNEESIVIIHNMIRNEYPRTLFKKVTWGKGVPVALQTEDGEWIKLPEVGKGSQAMANTLRAWIRK